MVCLGEKELMGCRTVNVKTGQVQANQDKVVTLPGRKNCPGLRHITKSFAILIKQLGFNILTNKTSKPNNSSRHFWLGVNGSSTNS